jgi:hypothetical protein
VKIRYTAPAFADLSLILDYIAEHSPQGTNRFRRAYKVLSNFSQVIHISAFAPRIRPFVV